MLLISTYKTKEINKIAFSMILGIIYATSDEIHQAFVPGRAARVTDVIIDSCGVFFGIILVKLINRCIKKLDIMIKIKRGKKVKLIKKHRNVFLRMMDIIIITAAYYVAVIIIENRWNYLKKCKKI